MKLPCLSVRASLTVFTPSRTNDTSAPTSGLPRLSRTLPLIVASDLLGLAESASLETNDTSASRDKPKPIPLLMRKTSASKDSLEAMCGRTGSGEETYRNPQNKETFSSTAQIVSSKWPCKTGVLPEFSAEKRGCPTRFAATLGTVLGFQSPLQPG